MGTHNGNHGVSNTFGEKYESDSVRLEPITSLLIGNSCKISGLIYLLALIYNTLFIRKHAENNLMNTIVNRKTLTTGHMALIKYHDARS